MYLEEKSTFLTVTYDARDINYDLIEGTETCFRDERWEKHAYYALIIARIGDSSDNSVISSVRLCVPIFYRVMSSSSKE